MVAEALPMGIDLLDITFRIEKQFKIRLQQADWESLARDGRHWDVTAGDLLDLIHSRRACRECGHDLRGLRDDGICPACESRFDFKDHIRQADWEALRQLLSDALNIEPEEIMRESRLLADLGMS
jgi:acyl carrier protein